MSHAQEMLLLVVRLYSCHTLLRDMSYIKRCVLDRVKRAPVGNPVYYLAETRNSRHECTLVLLYVAHSGNDVQDIIKID